MGRLGALLGADIDRQRASAIDVLVLNPSFALSRLNAALFNGYAPSTTRVTAVGVGALGSQAIAELVRGGFGCWTLIDYDHLLPHNTARHELPEQAVGFPKALAMQLLGNNLIKSSLFWRHRCGHPSPARQTGTDRDGAQERGFDHRFLRFNSGCATSCRKQFRAEAYLGFPEFRCFRPSASR